MSELNSLFRDLHGLRLRIRDLRTQADQGPRLLKKHQARIEHQEKLFHDAQNAIKHLKVTIHEKEVTLKGNLQKIARHQQQLDEASGKKEYDALRHEIDNEKQANRVLEDEILETMAALEEKTQQLPELERAVRQAKDESQKVDASMAARQAELRQRLVEAEKELQALEARLPPDLQPLYTRLVNAHGADALAPTQGRSCAGCYTEITSQGFHDLRAGRVVFCKSCGRLLYLPEGT